ncbi:hypothetical protein K7A41_20920 [Sphingobacterium sp. InxBP1]|uniref:hypothetical protein n=1 Tax=Sphingobacterium sp. InxBP1 TaxID=2870328 RepID=UPI002243C4C8|nr:hypothetical protein [Sphingobacterium sp. InxBP1]MCW8313701.1 hypothetical protein [Sphingobacterium sp. InxBP1]
MATIQYMEGTLASKEDRGWTYGEKVGFRFAFIFFILMVVPLDPEWYEKVFAPDSLYDFMASLAGGSRTGWIEVDTESGKWGFASYTSWWLNALIAVLGAAIWTILARNSRVRQYDALYYWLRVLVRYRIALGLIAFGFIKFFPMQMPFPSLANLNTDIGEYAPFKLYWQIVGVSYRYEIFLGFLEIAAGSLLFFRPTVVVGAIINAGVLFNIAHANLAYDGAVHVYSSYFVLLSLFLLLQYIPAIWKLFILRKPVNTYYYVPGFVKTWNKPLYFGIKTAIVLLFVFVYGYFRYERFYHEGRLKEPVLPGLPKAAGHYQVSGFVLNGKALPYSPADSVRWHEAFFERYSTLVYKVNKANDIDLGNGTPALNDVLKTYEFTGRAGGKTYLYYEIDTVQQQLYLIDKNQKFSKDLRRQLDKKLDVGLKALYGKAMGDSLHILKWDYERPTAQQIRLRGLDAEGNKLEITLDRIDESYLTGKEWYMKNTLFTY